MTGGLYSEGLNLYEFVVLHATTLKYCLQLSVPKTEKNVSVPKLGIIAVLFTDNYFDNTLDDKIAQTLIDSCRML